jgi:hypothetical protein
MRDQARGAIIIVALAVAYVSAVTYRHRAARAAVVPRSILEQLVGKNVSTILEADATVLVGLDGTDAEVTLRHSPRPLTLADRAQLADWLCGPSAPANTAVVLVVGRGESKSDVMTIAIEKQGPLRQLMAAPFALPCSSSARFYSVDLIPGLEACRPTTRCS